MLPSASFATTVALPDVAPSGIAAWLILISTPSAAVAFTLGTAGLPSGSPTVYSYTSFLNSPIEYLSSSRVSVSRDTLGSSTLAASVSFIVSSPFEGSLPSPQENKVKVIAETIAMAKIKKSFLFILQSPYKKIIYVLYTFFPKKSTKTRYLFLNYPTS